MKILGVDPGLRITGYGVISTELDSHENSAVLLEAGIVKTKPTEGISERLRKIHQSLSEVISELKPNVIVLEKLYAHYKHPATAILMGHARGVVCLLGGIHKIPLVSLASTHVKKSITGHGHAGKMQVQRMVQRELMLDRLPEPPDVADALAIALAYVSILKKKK